ncbi:hypothetical protein [Actinoplanes aureus]|uniref:Uncharacterized protein n=1 Tax=Actinoplanes aureus TaxID=2792083 RepID=A0A931C617_9ACTN|nr:hypothetical protein [Actinoplanes aureus]MBG0562864.1 hypothetical protein [Actinoplanes aureus]
MTETAFDAPARRLRYFHGRLLNAPDLREDQEQQQARIRRQLRCLLGYGVAHGLHVRGEPEYNTSSEDVAEETPEEVPEESSEEEAEDAGELHGPPRAKVWITPGLGIDALGNQIVVPGACEVDLWQRLPAEERTSGNPPKRVWVGVSFHEEDESPTRSVFVSDCGDTSDCEYGWTRETYRVRVTSKPPDLDRRCDTCGPLGDHLPAGERYPVLWLARIDVDWRRPVHPGRIHMNIRRLFGLRVPTVITGINWTHGATYSVEETRQLLGTTDRNGGLRVRFSDDIHVEGLKRGVIDIQVIEGGAGKNASSWFMGGQFEDLPADRFTRELRYRQTTRETLQEDDRVLITIRTAFLLDRCCRPVDGTHVGGRVPLLDDRPGAGGEKPERSRWCRRPPSGVGRWTSGSGAGGDVFESWFFVAGSAG